MKPKSSRIFRQLIPGSMCLVLTVALIGCTSSPSGTYVSEKNSKNYIELKSDGTFFNQENGMSLHGKYEMDGKVITLKSEIGFAAKGTIEGNVLIDKDGDRWVKK